MEIKFFENYNEVDKLLSLFVDGYNIHKNGRPDKFLNRNIDELKPILDETLKKDGVIIATDGDKVTGYLMFNIQQRVKKALWVDEVIVDKNYQHQGIGKKLIEKAENYAKEQKCDSIELCCWAFNTDAEKFYNNINYTVQRTIYEKKL